MNKLLFLGCNSDQIPYLKVAKKKGYFVVGTDINKNAPGIKFLDKYYGVGYEDVDSLIKLGKKENFSSSDKIFTASSQFAYVGASGFAKYFDIPFLDPANVDFCLDKTKFYRLFKKHNLDVPSWTIFNDDASNDDNANGTVFYLKSDYGKSPNYCFRVSNGKVPSLPKRYDRYFRRYFLAQEEIFGNHFRINWTKDDMYCFFKCSDNAVFPAYFIDINGQIKNNMVRLIRALGLENHLVKFDVIYRGNKCYFIDIGLEPPMRLKLYLNHIGYNFDELYFDHLVEKSINYPLFDDIPLDFAIINKTVEPIIKG